MISDALGPVEEQQGRWGEEHELLEEEVGGTAEIAIASSAADRELSVWIERDEDWRLVRAVVHAAHTDCRHT